MSGLYDVPTEDTSVRPEPFDDADAPLTYAGLVTELAKRCDPKQSFCVEVCTYRRYGSLETEWSIWVREELYKAPTPELVLAKFDADHTPNTTTLADIAARVDVADIQW